MPRKKHPFAARARAMRDANPKVTTEQIAVALDMRPIDVERALERHSHLGRRPGASGVPGMGPELRRFRLPDWADRAARDIAARTGRSVEDVVSDAAQRSLKQSNPKTRKRRERT